VSTYETNKRKAAISSDDSPVNYLKKGNEWKKSLKRSGTQKDPSSREGDAGDALGESS